MVEFSDEQKMMGDMVRRLARERLAPLAAEIDAEEVFPEGAFRALKEAALFGLTAPAKYGGADADVTTLCRVIEELAKVSAASALIVFSTSAVYRVLRECAGEEQNDRFFPEIVKGDKLAAFVLTEPEHGSDAASLSTRAERRGGEYRINGSADMAMLIEAARAMIYSTASAIDRGRGEKKEVESLVSMCKCFATDAAMKVTTDAVQILGGYGYTKDYPVERMMRDAKALQLLDGTNQIQRIVIARNLIGD